MVCQPQCLYTVQVVVPTGPFIPKLHTATERVCKPPPPRPPHLPQLPQPNARAPKINLISEMALVPPTTSYCPRVLEVCAPNKPQNPKCSQQLVLTRGHQPQTSAPDVPHIRGGSVKKKGTKTAADSANTARKASHFLFHSLKNLRKLRTRRKHNQQNL